MHLWLQVDSVKSGTQLTLHLVAPTKQEKAAWITDISQCMDNVHFDNLYNNTTLSAGVAVVPQFVKSDPSLFKDDVDIRQGRENIITNSDKIRFLNVEVQVQ